MHLSPRKAPDATPAPPPASRPRTSALDLSLTWILTGILALMALLALWIALQIPLALIDDVTFALLIDRLSLRGLGRLLHENFLANSAHRFWWSWQLYQAFSWLILGAHPGLHHVLIFLIRIACCAASICLLRIIVKSPHPLACLAVAAYGFFLPIVPESRLGTQEPQLILLLLLCLVWVCRLIVKKGGDLKQEPWHSSLAFFLCFLLLSGCKETTLPLLFLLTAVIIACQCYHRKLNIWLTLGLCTVTLITTWRVSVVLNTSPYVISRIGVRIGSYRYYTRLWSLASRLTLYDPHRPWLYLACLAALTGLLRRVAADIKAEKRLRSIGATALILAVIATFAGIVAKTVFVPRYMYPLVWLCAVPLGIGTHALLSTRRFRVPAKCAVALAVLLIAAANYPMFLWQFACEKSIRDGENALIRHLTPTLTARPETPAYIFGCSDRMRRRRQWDNWRLNEYAANLQKYYRRFRPRFHNAPPIHLESVEKLAAKPPHRPALIVSQAITVELKTYCPPSASLHCTFTSQPVRDSAPVRLALAAHSALDRLKLARVPCQGVVWDNPIDAPIHHLNRWHLFELTPPETISDQPRNQNP